MEFKFIKNINELLEMADNNIPEYDKCDKPQKEIYWDICKNLKKKGIMYCIVDKKPCIAWEGYKHGD